MNNKIIFDIDSFKDELEKISLPDDKISYCDTLVDELTSVVWKYKDDKIERILKNANLLEKYPRLKKAKHDNIKKPKYKKPNSKSYINKTSFYDIHSEKYNRIILESEFREFKEYLWDLLIPFINKTKIDFENDIEDEIIREKIKRGELSESDKYPLFDFDIKQIKSYADRIFPKIEDKILYYSYIIKIYYQDDYRDKKWRDNYDSKIKKVEMEREYLLTQIKFDNKSNVSNTNNKNNKDITNVKYVWLGTINQLRIFLELLQIQYFIEDSLKVDPKCDKLIANFVDNTNNLLSKAVAIPISFQPDIKQTEIAYIFGTLNTKGLIPKKNMWKNLEYIIKSKGQYFNTSRLGVYYQTGKPRSRKIIDSIIEETLRIKE